RQECDHADRERQPQSLTGKGTRAAAAKKRRRRAGRLSGGSAGGDLSGKRPDCAGRREGSSHRAETQRLRQVRATRACKAGMNPPLLFDGPAHAQVTLLLAHGSGAPMDSPAMNAATTALAAEGLRVARFEFGYMAARRTEGSRRPPPKAETLNPEFCAAVAELGATGKLVIGGKSMGGRVASMVADGLYAEGRIAGLLCLGYPFHPPEKPAQLRTAHLTTLRVPTLICQ